MKHVNTFGIQFVIRKHRIKEGKAPIYARITVNTNRCEISVKRRIHTDKWNNGKGISIRRGLLARQTALRWLDY